MKNYEYWADRLAGQELQDFTSNEEAKLWLKIHAISKDAVMKKFIEAENLQLSSKKVDDKAKEIFSKINNSSIREWNDKLDSFCRDENRKQFEELNIPQIKMDLMNVQHFQWGGDQNNSLDNYFVSHYVKEIRSYQELQTKLAADALPVVSNYVVASWYNHWSSIVIEHLFKQHEKVLPTVGQVKSIDFIICGIPFDLKVTYIPKFMERDIRKHLKNKGFHITELSILKDIAKRANIDFDKKISPNRQHYQILESIKNRGGDLLAMTTHELQLFRDEKINFIKNNSKTLIKKLYEEQGAKRFGAENRLYMILIDREDMDNSWKLKRDFTRLEPAIKQYLDAFDPSNLDRMKVNFKYNGHDYSTHADILFVDR